MSGSSDDGDLRSIATRISQLNQIFMGRAVTSTTYAQAGRESLLDALLALYNECNNTQFMRNSYIAKFVNKYTKTIKELRGLRISINDFNIKNTIGRGHFGEVQVVKEKQTGDVYALKVLRKSDTLAQQNVAFYEEERDIMAKSSSVWITQLQYAFQDARCLYLVMEFHPGGDLLSLLARFDDTFEEKMARFYLAEMVLALRTLHTMGYVHRDVKPENILIDRTGHVKLADFGSACRLSVATASVSNMPVGTPDYICPEVLMMMNSDDTTGKFGPECDWWSLGVCLYEMLYGKTPFTDEKSSMVVTYANIMNHKKCLKFPQNEAVSKSATSLIARLLTDSVGRLEYEQICVHTFFSDIDFDNIRQTRPPFIPTVTSKDDTSNFDDFEKVKRGPDAEELSRKSTGLTGKDFPFIGFTFTKPLATQERPSLSTEVSSPAAKGSLERRLTQKSKELNDSRERYKDVEHKFAASTSELNRLRSQMSDRESRIEKLEAERRTLELDKAHYMTEVKSLNRLLEMEKQDRQQTEDKAMNLLEDIRKQSDVANQLRDQTNTQELQEHKEVISQFEEDGRQMSERIERLEHQLAEETAARYDALAKNDLLKAKVNEMKQSLRERDASDQVAHLREELSKANQKSYEAIELLATMRQSKTRLEEELYTLRRRSNMEDVLRSRISDAEENRQQLEMHIHRLEITEKREAALRDQLSEKSHQVTQLAERIAELEEENESEKLEQTTREKLWQQREEQLHRQIKELESLTSSIRDERSTLEEQSILLTDNYEDKLLKINDQEETIYQLKSNILTLENQLEDMREDLETAAEENQKSRKVRSRRSGYAQTETPPWKTLRQQGQRIGQTQTDSDTAAESPARRSIHIQYEDSSPERHSNGLHVSLNTSNISPRKRSSQMKIDGTSPNITSQRRSNNTQTDTPTRRSNNMQTEVTVSVSMSAGPDSPIMEESIDSIDSRDQEQNQTVESAATSDDSANTTVIHCGQGDTPKAKKPRKSEEHTRKMSEKETTRRGTEEWSDLQQQREYLELRVSNLEDQLNDYKEQAHQQRLRALDLKIEMRDKTTGLETEVSELKEKLDKAELAVSAAKEEASNSGQKETTLREKLDRVQRDLDEIRIEGRRKITDLTMERDDLQSKAKALNMKVTNLEPKENELREYQRRCEQLAPKNKDLERQVEGLQDDRTRLRLDVEKYRDELQQSKCEHDKLKVQHNELKIVAEELEQQLQDFEQLSEQYEKKASKWTQHKTTYETAVNERESELEETHRHLNKEKSFRQRDEMKIKQLTDQVASLQETHKKKVDTLTAKLEETKKALKQMADQLTRLEHGHSHLEIDLGTSKRHLEIANEDNLRLKEEISGLITTVTKIKGSNLKLSKTLEEAMDRYEMLASQNTDFQNQAETNMVNANHEKYKLESTLSQQVKLIDYLQVKVENPPKKKKGWFGSMKSDGQPMGIQFRELQHSLEHERDKNSMLRQQITRLQTELYQKQVEGSRSTDQTDLKRSTVTEALTHTPSSRSEYLSSSNSVPKVNTGGSRPRKERMHHNIPHRFVTGLNSRATKCAVCLGSVHFVKQAAKCQECQVVCHPKCAPNLPATCGLPTEYMSHFSDVMARQSSSRLSVADLRLSLTAWMKIPRPGKQLWEKKWITLANNHIHIYSSQDTSEDHVEEFALCPSNGTVTVHSAVTAAELTNTASTDLPYILRLEFEPETTCWPGRSIYLMALTFEEKQRWVATLEAIIDTRPRNEQEAKLLGNTILSLAGETRMELNCTLPINDQVVLIGADDGLYVADLASGTGAGALTKVHGVSAIYHMEVIAALDVVVMITGRERKVVLVGIGEVKNAACGAAQPSVTPYPLPEATACTTLAFGVTAMGTFLCTALADKILLLVYDEEEQTFILAKELLTSQACSCIYFGQNYVIVGTDKFHKIDLNNYQMSDLLDKRDTTLAFAAFGAAHYDSFPIAVLQVAAAGDTDEYLLCFHEFGVFVDSYGRRSRDDDMKWSGLPLAFTYQAPYLYTIHFNAIQVTEIPPSHQHHSEGAKTMLRLPGPRYLGPALSEGAVYIGSSHENSTEITCVKGNLVTSDIEDDKENTPALTRQKTSKRQLTESTFVSPEESSPPNIQQLDRSPVSSLSRRKVARVVQQQYTSSTSSDTDAAAPNIRVGVQIRARAEERRRNTRPREDSSDTSF